MEMNGVERLKLDRGEVNAALQLEEQDHMYKDEDSTSESGEKMAEEQTKSYASWPKRKMEFVHGFLAEHRHHICRFIQVALAAGFVAAVIAACALDFRRAVPLLVLFLVITFFLIWDWTMERYGDQLWEKLSPVRDFVNKHWFWIRWIMYVSLIVAVVSWFIFDTAMRGTRQIVSFFGLLLLIFIIMLFSKHPFSWSWQTLISGTLLQFVFGLMLLRTNVGLGALGWLGDKAEKFMSFADVGSEFVFGENYQDHFFAFKVMPILVFLSAVISVLYHIGFMQWVICKIGFIMQHSMGTSPIESMAAAGNIFLGQTETVLLIKPYMSVLTLSEVHAVMTGGFAGISGTILGAFISFGIEASHLLTASLMSAPASLAMAKTFWPETEIPLSVGDQDLKMAHGETKNVLEAVSQGAIDAVSVVASIIANIISFLAILAFCDAILSWFGGMLDCPELSFGLICSYVFMPLSFMLGVAYEDSFIVAELLGIKTFLNEFVAYQKLSVLIAKRKAGGPEYVDNVKQYISVHSETIATYALCGFSNFASLGMTIGAMVAIAPHRQSDYSNCGLRALIAGSFSCFMTACIAGVLYIPDLDCPFFLTSEFSNTNVTSSTQVLTCCTQLYNSVTVKQPWNMTLGEGFSLSSLSGCCALIPPTHFNCSSVL